MSSAAVAALVSKAGATSVASSAARRSRVRVRSLDGLTQGLRSVGSGSSLPSGSSAPPAAVMRPDCGSAIMASGSRLNRCRSLSGVAMTASSAREASAVGQSEWVGASCAKVDGRFVLAGEKASSSNSRSRMAAAAVALTFVAAANADAGDLGDRDSNGISVGGGSRSIARCRDAVATSPTTRHYHQHHQEQEQQEQHEERILTSSRHSFSGLQTGPMASSTAVRGTSSNSSFIIADDCADSDQMKATTTAAAAAGDFGTFNDLDGARGGRRRRSGGGDGVRSSAMARVAAAGKAGEVAAGAGSSSSINDVYAFETELVGAGNRSTVSSATHRLTGQRVAVKRLSRSETTRLEVMEEVNMLKLAGTHPNVVTMQAFFEDQDAYYIVMDLCQGGELYHRLADKGRYSEGQAARIMAEVAEAVRFLHRHGIVHFDLKPENIMLAVGDDSIPEVRLADFGSAFRQHRQIFTARDYTIAYTAPEVLASEPVDEKVDMWALGVVMWVLLTGKHPFDAHADLSEDEVARRITEEEPDLRCRGIRHVSPEGKDLVGRLLAKDPEDRPSAQQMLAHPWLRAVMTRAKATNKNSLRRRHRRRPPLPQQQQPQPQPQLQQQLTGVSWSASSPSAADDAGDMGRSPPRRRHQARGDAVRDESGPAPSTSAAATAAAAAAAVASVTGGDPLSA